MIGYDMFLSLFENTAVFSEKAMVYVRYDLVSVDSYNFASILRVYKDLQNKFPHSYLELFKQSGFIWSNLISIKYFMSCVRVMAYEQMNYVSFESMIIS